MTTLFPKEVQYRVLTLWQPWASLLIHGIKKIETRPSPTSWTQEKGAYLIHAASKWTNEMKKLCLSEPFKTELEKLRYIQYAYEDQGVNFYNINLPLGQIIGAIEITNDYLIIRNIDTLKEAILKVKNKNKLQTVHDNEYSYGDYTPGRYAWLTQNPRILKTPIPYKGGQGYYQKFKGDVNKLEFI